MSGGVYGAQDKFEDFERVHKRVINQNTPEDNTKQSYGPYYDVMFNHK